MCNLRFPNLFLFSTRTKLLMQGIASFTSASTPACNILFISCVAMQISYIGDCLVFSIRTAMIAYTKEQHLTPTYFPLFLTSLL